MELIFSPCFLFLFFREPLEVTCSLWFSSMVLCSCTVNFSLVIFEISPTRSKWLLLVSLLGKRKPGLSLGGWMPSLPSAPVPLPTPASCARRSSGLLVLLPKQNVTFYSFSLGQRLTMCFLLVCLFNLLFFLQEKKKRWRSGDFLRNDSGVWRQGFIIEM